MKKQVVVIHGGDTFDTYEEYLLFLKTFEADIEYFKGSKDWKGSLSEELGDGYEVIRPIMPNKINAKYLEWKIWFEKLTPFLSDGVILIGHSLGGTFLAKFLSENKFSKKVRATFLIAPPHDGIDLKESLADFILPVSLKMFEEQGGAISIYHSIDDPVVPYADFEKYKEAVPSAQAFTFDGRAHFKQETFPELIRAIQAL